MGTEHASDETPDEQKLFMLLASHGIDATAWGQGPTKTVRHLLGEVLAGECRLAENDSSLTRELHIVDVNVYRDGPRGERKRLIETKQVFSNGKIRERASDGRGSISEKIMRDEEPLAAAARALKEELHIEGHLAILPEGTAEENKESTSYPGLVSRYVKHRFSVVLPPESVREQYEEAQKDKTTYFNWSR